VHHVRATRCDHRGRRLGSGPDEVQRPLSDAEQRRRTPARLPSEDARLLAVCTVLELEHDAHNRSDDLFGLRRALGWSARLRAEDGADQWYRDLIIRASSLSL
jgi:hypothetical protein